jgi:putative membrane protein
MMGWYEGTGWGSWSVMMLVMLAFWAVVVVGIVALLRWTATPQPRRQDETMSAAPSAQARAVLDERFARGDIDEAEYTSRLATLQGKA